MVSTAMDPSYVDDEDEDDADAQAMAAMMGFSGFGTQKQPAKKRKYNAGTDAYVDGQELAKLDKGGKKGQGSGGNTMPLGRPRVFGTGPVKATTKYIGEVESVPNVRKQEALGNSDEIDLEDALDGQEEGPNYVDTSKTPPAQALEVEGPVEIEEPPPISEEEAEAMQARIDAILEGIGSKDDSDIPSPSIPTDSNMESPRRSYGLPQRPEFGAGDFQGGQAYQPPPRYSRGDSASVKSSLRQSHRGGRNPTWYIDYYDPAFNQNPWASLEQENGLEPLCKWPDNVGRRQKP